VNDNAFDIWFIILVNVAFEFVYGNHNEECLRMCMTFLVNDY
jgi:hypothetical protein